MQFPHSLHFQNAAVTIIAKLFLRGRSQVLRLPAELRLQGQQVRIKKIGNALWLQPEGNSDQNMAQWLREFYASAAPLRAESSAVRDDPAPQERDWS